MSLLAWIQAFIALLPIINKLIDLFTTTPAQARGQLISDLHDAFEKADISGGDTSDIEKIIREGKK